jgi:hypothetical protein
MTENNQPIPTQHHHQNLYFVGIGWLYSVTVSLVLELVLCSGTGAAER